jgi:hypothetical protein
LLSDDAFVEIDAQDGLSWLRLNRPEVYKQIDAMAIRAYWGF